MKLCVQGHAVVMRAEREMLQKEAELIVQLELIGAVVMQRTAEKRRMRQRERIRKIVHQRPQAEPVVSIPMFLFLKATADAADMFRGTVERMAAKIGQIVAVGVKIAHPKRTRVRGGKRRERRVDQILGEEPMVFELQMDPFFETRALCGARRIRWSAGGKPLASLSYTYFH